MDKRILDVKPSDFNALPIYAHLLSLLSTNKEKMMPWVYNTFVPLQYNTKYGLNFLAFSFSRSRMNSICPFIIRDGISRRIVFKRWNSSIDFIKDCIDDGYYLEMPVSEYYIPLYDSYMQYERSHSILVYGYDEGFVYAADNFKNRKYSFGKIAYSDAEKAITLHKDVRYEDSFLLYRLDDMNYNYNFDIISFKKNLNDYIHSSYSDVHNLFFFDEESLENFDSKLGVGVYDAIIQDISGADSIDQRIFCVLKDHKQVISESLEYLKDKRYLPMSFNTESFDDILLKSKRLVYMVIKFNLVHDERIIKRIIDLLLEIKDKEYQFLVDLYANISEKPVFTIPKIIKKKSFCKFECTDRRTKGAWQKNYGTKGYSIPFFPCDIVKKPDDIFFSIDATTYAVPDRSDLQRILDLCDDKLHIYFKPRYVSIDVATNIPEARVTFYLVNRTDQTNEPFTAEIKVYDSSGYLLCENIIEDYKGGVYITYKLSGRIQFHILRRTNTDAPCGEVYGLFFD